MFRFAFATLLAASPALAEGFVELPRITFDVAAWWLDTPAEVFTAGHTDWWNESEDLVRLNIFQTMHDIDDLSFFYTN